MDTLELVNLSKLDLLELGNLLPPGTLIFDPPERTTDTHGELSTVAAVVFVSLASLRVLAVWLSKDRRVLKFRKQVEGVDSLGRPKSVVTEVSIDSEVSAPEALKHLAKALEVDIDGLVD